MAHFLTVTVFVLVINLNILTSDLDGCLNIYVNILNLYIDATLQVASSFLL